MIKATINLYIDLFTTLAKSHNHSKMSFGIELSIETEKLFEFGTWDSWNTWRALAAPRKGGRLPMPKDMNGPHWWSGQAISNFFHLLLTSNIVPSSSLMHNTCFSPSNHCYLTYIFILDLMYQCPKLILYENIL